jgi:hypothetical protein
MRHILASRLCYLMVILTAFAHPSNLKPPSPPRYVDKDALAVYRTMIPESIDGKVALIVTTTVNPTASVCKDLGTANRPSGEYAEALADLVRVNNEEWSLDSLLSGERTQFISQRELAPLFSGNVNKGWKKFYREHPDASGYIRLSAVGFNRTRTLAAVYSAVVSCSECGHGSVQFLKRGSNGWEKVASPFPFCYWIS